MKLTAVLSILSAVLLVSVLSTEARAADGQFAKKHPRRAQVLKRDRHEQNANKNAYKHGQITRNQEKQLNKEDRSIRHQEMADAAANGGHITTSEQNQLNHEENRVNRQRSQDERADQVNSN